MNQHTKHRKQGTSHARNWFLVFVFLGLIVLLVSSLFKAGKNIKVSKENLREAETEYEELYARGESISDLLNNFENDFGFEKYVRENFGVVKPGEKVVIIVASHKENDEPRNEEEGQD
jgi:cell division protein FtsB